MRREALTSADLERVKAVLLRWCGLSLAQGLHAALENAVQLAAASLDLSCPTLLQRLACGDRVAIQTLAEHTLVHESYFFRQPRHFDALRTRVLSRLAPGEEALLWSAGCAAGEEAYSLAMTVALAPGCPDARIVASDLSRSALAKARAGSYSAWSLRGMDPALPSRFFEPDREPAQVKPELAQKVEWVLHNLLADPPVRDCHAIFCRNVLIYFDHRTALEVLDRLVNALRPGGCLMLGTAEAPLAAGMGLEWIEDEELFVRPSPSPRRAPDSRGHAAPREKAPAPRVELRPQAAVPTGFDQAREAARRGLSLEAERLARDSAEREARPESWLLLAMMAEERGDLFGALDAARRAVEVDPGMAMGHATLAMLLRRAGAFEEAEQARTDALQVLAALDESVELRSVEPITAGALRLALGYAADNEMIPRGGEGRT